MSRQNVPFPSPLSPQVRTIQRVAVVIPAYNEGEVLFDVITQAREVFAASRYDVDIIVVDDGSRDRTGAEAQRAGAYVIHHILNSGAGGATATGLAYANQKLYDAAATMDADGQHAPEDVIAGFDYIASGDCDLAIGSRLINSEGMSKIKVLGNRGLSFITTILFGVNVTDSQSGLRIFSRRSLRVLRWDSSGYEFCSEMLWRAHYRRLKIAEYPIRAIYSEYSKAKGQNNWNAVNIVKSLVFRRVMELMQ